MACIVAAIAGMELITLGTAVAKAAVPIAIIALDQGIRLFITKKYQGKKRNKNIEKKENNMMDKLVVFNKISKASFIPIDKTVDTCLKQIENLQLVFETNDFATSLDYLSDAWRALARNKVKLFRESICESYRFARIAKNKITKNPNHLLGVYSIIIFCGFCKFSEFGNDVYSGLQHIKDTLNEMSKGSSRQSLLRGELAKIIKSSMYLTQTEQIYLKNIISFSIRIQVLVGCIIRYCKDNDAENTARKTELKSDENEKFGDMISILFPSATLTELENDEDLLNYLEWTPNIMEGRYFGGGKDKIFEKIDFWSKIYPVVFGGAETLTTRNAFITIYFKEIIKTIFATKHFTTAIKSCMMDEGDSLVIKSRADVNKIKKIVLFLTLPANMNQVINDKNFKMPTKLIFMKGFNNEFDLCFCSRYFGINNIVFDDDVNGVLGFCDVLAVSRGVVLDSLTEITIRNTTLPLTLANKFFWVLHNLCPNLKILNMQSMVIKYSLYYPEKFSDILNLQFMPKSIEIFRFNDIKFVDSNEKRIDEYNEQIIKQLMSEHIGSKRKIIYAMSNVNNKNNIDMIRCYLKNNVAGIDMDDLHIFSSKYLDDNPNWHKQSSLHTMDLSYTEMTEYNLNVLFNQFISLNCQNMSKIILNNCGITDSFISLISEFYETNEKHSDSLILDLSNNLNDSIEGISNDITTERIALLITNELKYRNGINITYNDENEKLQMISRMDEIKFVPIDTEEKIDSKEKILKDKTRRRQSYNVVEQKYDMHVMNDEPHRYILDKSGEKKGKRKYKVRQLKLSNKGVFEYWDNKTLKGTIDLKNKGIISVCISDSKKNFGWQIVTKQETYYFTANTEDERDEWIKNIDVFNNEIEFDGDVNQIEKFSDLNSNYKNGMKMDSLTKISIKNMTVSFTVLHELFAVLNDICIGLKVLHIESLLMNSGDTLNLHLIPKSIEDFRFSDIASKKNDLNVFSAQLNSYYSLCKMEFSYIEMTKDNFNVLMNQFIGSQCPNMTNIILNNCGIMNSCLLVVSTFYKTFKDHKLCMFDLSNNIVFDAKNKNKLKGIENEIRTHKIISLLANELKYRNDINITYDNKYEQKVQIMCNMGEFVFFPMDSSERIELKLTNKGVVQYWSNNRLKGSINLKEDEFTSVSMRETGGQFGWQIVARGRTFVFTASNENERNEWIQNIKRVLDEAKDKKPQEYSDANEQETVKKGTEIVITVGEDAKSFNRITTILSNKNSEQAHWCQQQYCEGIQRWKVLIPIAILIAFIIIVIIIIIINNNKEN